MGCGSSKTVQQVATAPIKSTPPPFDPSEDSTSEINLAVVQTSETKNDQTQQPQANKGQTQQHPISGIKEDQTWPPFSEGETKPPISGTNRDQNWQPPTSGNDKKKIQQPPTSGTNKGQTQQHPTSGTNKGQTQQRPTSGTNKGQTQQHPTSGTNRGQTQQPPTSGTNKGQTQQPPTSGTNKGQVQQPPTNKGQPPISGTKKDGPPVKKDNPSAAFKQNVANNQVQQSAAANNATSTPSNKNEELESGANSKRLSKSDKLRNEVSKCREWDTEVLPNDGVELETDTSFNQDVTQIDQWDDKPNKDEDQDQNDDDWNSKKSIM